MAKGRHDQESAAVLDALQPLLGRASHQPVERSAAMLTMARTTIVPPTRAASPAPPPAMPLPRVILPGESTPPCAKEVHPHRRAERCIYIAASIALLAGAGTLLMTEPRELSDGRSTRSTVAAWPGMLAAPEMPAAPAVPESTTVTSRLEIAGRLPANVRLTANGQPLAGRDIALSPGTYVLTAAAPGLSSVRDTLTVAAHDTVVWSPRLTARRSSRPAAASSRRELSALERRRLALEREIAAESLAIQRVSERLRELEAESLKAPE